MSVAKPDIGDGLPLNEFVETILGELPGAGYPCVVIRLAGCNLDCAWCDTPNRDRIIERIRAEKLAEMAFQTGRRHSLVTGGEPLIHKNTPLLTEALLDSNMVVYIETNGSISLESIPRGVIKSVDLKTPSSGFSGSFLDSNVEYLGRRDVAKFVVADMDDFEWSLSEINRLDLLDRTQVVVSPVFGRMGLQTLASAVLESCLPIRLSLQLHKIIGIK